MSLVSFQSHPNSFCAAGGEAAFAAYADIVCEQLSGVADRVGTMPGNTISLFGHAVFLNAVAMKICQVWGADAGTINKLKDLDLGESEGIVIDRIQGTACTLEHKSVRPHELWA